jgi:hypothetical protein
MLRCENFEDLRMWRNGRALPQDAQKAGLLTRPAPARRDAPFPGQGRHV